MEQTQETVKRIYTIGHSNQTSDEFVVILRQHGIRRVVDVRSAPYSKYTPQFNKAEIEQALRIAQIEYRYSGHRLGGKPENEGLYTPSGSPDYEKLAALPGFQQELQDVVDTAGDGDTALMCSEGDPMVCHRERLLARVLRQQGVEVLHILPDGEIHRIKQGTLF